MLLFRKGDCRELRSRTAAEHLVREIHLQRILLLFNPHIAVMSAKHTKCGHRFSFLHGCIHNLASGHSVSHELHMITSVRI